MERYKTESLYIVRPTRVIYHEDILLKHDLRELKSYYYQNTRLEQSTNDIDIVSIEDNVITNITSDDIIEQYNDHFEVDKRYIGISENEKVLLVKELCKMQFENFVWNNSLKKLFILRKPEYTKEELIQLLEQIKQKNTEDKVKVKKIERNYSKPMGYGFYNI